MKAVWSGAITFGLVNIPIKLYSAISEHSLGFSMLCGKCHSPLKYERWCKSCDKEVPWQDVVKGLKLANDKYFIATKESIAKLRPEKTDTIDIAEFVEGVHIDPIYFEHHYYIGPEKKAEKPYYLFKKALEVSGKAAIGKFVMRNKEYVCAISPYKEGLLLSTLNYAYEIRDLEKVPNLGKVPKVSSSELTLAKKLINQLTVKSFNINEFKDTFAERLKQAIKTSKGKKVKHLKESKVKRVAKKDETLLSNLKASLKTPRASARTKAKKKPK